MNEIWRNRIRVILRVLTVIALAWIAWALWQSKSEIEKSLLHVEYKWFVIIFFINAYAAYLLFEVFYILVNFQSKGKYRKTELAHLYFRAEIMKQLPGRFAGILYQYGTTTKSTLGQWVGVNIFHMAIGIFFSVGISIVVFVLVEHAYIGIALYFTLFAIYVIGWAIAKKTLNAINPQKNKLIIKIKDNALLFFDIKLLDSIKIFGIYSISWFVYYIAWGLYGIAWPDIDFILGVKLCCFYTIAWFVGYISFITPSGIGVREVIFFALAKDFSPDVVAGMVIVGRAMLLVVDIFFGLVFLGKKNEK